MAPIRKAEFEGEEGAILKFIGGAVAAVIIYPFFLIPLWLWKKFLLALRASVVLRQASLILLILGGGVALLTFLSAKGFSYSFIFGFYQAVSETLGTFVTGMRATPGIKGVLLNYVGIVLLAWLVFSPVYIALFFWGQRGGVMRHPRKFSKARVKAGFHYLFLGFSVENRKPLYIPNKIRAEHMLVLGSTGTGKTTSVLEPAIQTDIKTGKGLIFMTGKEEPDVLNRIYSYCVEAGRGADLRVFTLSDKPASDSYNPLVYGDETGLRDLLMEAFNWDNPYYRDQAKSALLYVFSALVGTGKRFTLKDLYYGFTEKGCLKTLAAMETDPEIKHHLESYIGDWKTFRENMRGLAANLEDYTARRLASRLCVSNPVIDLMDAYENQRIVIFVLNSLKYGETARRLGKMIMQNIRFLAGKVAEEGSRHFFPVYIDEFHHFVYPEFFSMVAQCRSADIGLTLSTQSFSDMKGDDWDITTQVVQNTNTKVILRQNDAESAEFASKLAGTQPVSLMTEQVEKKLFLGRMPTGLGSIRPEEEFVIHPNLMRTLPTGQAAVIVRGHADVLQLGQSEDPNTYCDIANFQRERVAVKDSNAPVNLYERWREKEDEKKERGIRPPKVKDSNEPAHGLDALRASIKGT